MLLKSTVKPKLFVLLASWLLHEFHRLPAAVRAELGYGQLYEDMRLHHSDSSAIGRAESNRFWVSCGK